MSAVIKPTGSEHGLLGIKVIDVSDRMHARFEHLESAGSETSDTAFRFVDLRTSQDNVICVGLSVHNLIETFNEFLSQKIFESESYSVLINGCGFDAKLGRDEKNNVPELHINIHRDGEVVEVIACRRYEMRVVVNKLQRLLRECMAL